jgi:hypothetical protein
LPLGATIIRVETDAQGSAYEAHMTKSDGSFVTAHLDKSFAGDLDGPGLRRSWRPESLTSERRGPGPCHVT